MRNGEARELEVFKQARSAQERFAYFFLAAAGAAISFALLRGAGRGYDCATYLLGGAILAWGLSFYWGCEAQLASTKILFANYRALQVQQGTHAATAAEPALAPEALRRLDQLMRDMNKEGAAWSASVFGVSDWFLAVFGVACH